MRSAAISASNSSSTMKKRALRATDSALRPNRDELLTLHPVLGGIETHPGLDDVVWARPSIGQLGALVPSFRASAWRTPPSPPQQSFRHTQHGGVLGFHRPQMGLVGMVQIVRLVRASCPVATRRLPSSLRQARGWKIEGGRRDEKPDYSPTPEWVGMMTQKQNAKQRAKRRYYLKRRAAMTPKQLDAERAHQREYECKRWARMTPEERAAKRAHQREYYRKWWASMTPKERAVKRAHRREYLRKRRANMPSKALAAHRKYQREYQRKRRAIRTRKQLDPERHFSDGGKTRVPIPVASSRRACKLECSRMRTRFAPSWLRVRA
jgi:hypothetical protein